MVDLAYFPEIDKLIHFLKRNIYGYVIKFKFKSVNFSLSSR